MAKLEGYPEDSNLGHKSSEAQVPFMITRDMEQQLSDLGWNKKSRDALTPEKANEILKAGERWQETESTSADSEQDIEESKQERQEADKVKLREVREGLESSGETVVSEQKKEKKESAEYWLQRALEKARSFLPDIDPEVSVRVETGRAIPDNKEQKPFQTSFLTFEHKKGLKERVFFMPSKKFSMIIGPMTRESGEDYLNNEFEDVVRKSCAEQFGLANGATQQKEESLSERASGVELGGAGDYLRELRMRQILKSRAETPFVSSRRTFIVDEAGNIKKPEEPTKGE